MSAETLKKYKPLMAAFALIAYLGVTSDLYGDRMFKRFQKAPKEIEVIFESDQRLLKGKLIGKNADYILMQTDDSAVKAIPVSSDVQEIIINR